MTVITGDLILVTDRPSAVTEVWIRAGEIRTHDGGLVLEDRDREPIHDGWLEINVLPGPAILTLVSHGTVRKAIPIVVPDAEATSLEDAVNAARLAQPSLKTWLEELAASILAGTKGPKGDRGPEGKQGPAGPAPYIQNGTWWTGGVDTGIDATGPQGDPGIAPHIQGETWWVGEVDTGVPARGPKGDLGPTGTLDLIDESVQTTIDTVAIPAIEGARDEALGQVEGAVNAEADSIKWERPAITSGTDLNLVLKSGSYAVPSYAVAETLINRPQNTDAVDRAELRVFGSSSGIHHTWIPIRPAGLLSPIMHRRRDNVGTWTSWERINAFTSAKESYIMQSISAAKWEKRAFVRDENLNDITTAGVYYAPSYTVANSLVNNPVELSRSAIDRAKIEVAVTGSYISQIWTTIPAATKAAETVERHRDPTGEWSEWVVYGGGARDEDKPVTSFETLALASKGMEGEHVGTRSLLQSLSGEDSPVWSWWAPTPDEPLEIPTHDGGGQTCHPAVLYFPSGWGGWKYWMAHTPYPNFQEAHEDPNIAVSDDGVNWQVPNGVTNPLDDGLGRPNYHNSDTHLAMWGNTMVLTWRTVDRPNGGQNIIYARTSQNGVTWTPKVEVLKVPLGTNESTLVSQSLVKMPTGWRLYGIRSNYAPNRLGYYETSVETLPKTSDWGAAKDCDLGDIPAGRDPWHSEVQRLTATDWVAVISDGRRGSTGVDGDIYLARSTDGIKWDVSPMPLTPRNTGVINSLYKTGFVVSGTGTSRSFDMWVSGYRTDKRTWGIYRTRAEFRGPKQVVPLPVTRVGTGSPEGKVAAPVGDTYTDTAATNGAIRWVKTSGTGNTGWRVEYGDTGKRNVSDLLTDDWSGSIYVSRRGPLVSITSSNLRPFSTGVVPVANLPSGYRPASTEVGVASEDNVTRSVYAFGYSPHKVEIRGIAREQGWLNFSMSFFTNDPWPTILPGTPA